MAAFNLNGVEFQDLRIDQSRLSDLSMWLENALAERPLKVRVASADASFRSYYRVATPTRVYIVMDAPPPAEDTRPFHQLAVRLREHQIAVPEVFDWDEKQGFMLLEDFGDTTLLQHLGPRQDEDPLRSTDLVWYRQCLSQLVELQQRASPAGLPLYDGAFLRQEMELFRRWLVQRHLGLSWSRQDERRWSATLSTLVTTTLEQPRVFVHRDYHSRNLMVLESRAGDGQLGIIDFQDAMQGPLLYDVASLLKDCYVKLNEVDRTDLFERYVSLAVDAGLPIANAETAQLQFHAMGAQRHLKAAGIFARLWHRDGKRGYLNDIPRTLSYLVDAARFDSRLSWCAELIERRILPRLPRAESA